MNFAYEMVPEMNDSRQCVTLHGVRRHVRGYLEVGGVVSNMFWPPKVTLDTLWQIGVPGGIEKEHKYN